jgi:hypothetical protein
VAVMLARVGHQDAQQRGAAAARHAANAGLGGRGRTAACRGSCYLVLGAGAELSQLFRRLHKPEYNTCRTRTQRGVRILTASIHPCPAVAHFLVSPPTLERDGLVKHNDVQDVIND